VFVSKIAQWGVHIHQKQAKIKSLLFCFCEVLIFNERDLKHKINNKKRPPNGGLLKIKLGWLNLILLQVS